ncbi:MAG: DNA-methyltransferase [Candidatus Helarchaeota archaeon]
MDCLEGMRKHIADSSIDLVITSPPYNIKLKSRNDYTKNYIDNLPEAEYREKIKELIDELARVTKEDGSIWINMKSRYLNEKNEVVTANYGSLEPPTWILNFSRNKLYLKNLIIWNYDINSDTKNNKLHPRYEFFFWFTKQLKNYKFFIDEIRVPPKTKDKRNNPKGANPTDVWYIPLVKGNSRERNFHPAQYPEKLIERIMKACSKEYDTVLDPFMGSGTTMAVAKKLNRICIGFEINKTYVKNTEKRLNLSQKSLADFSNLKKYEADNIILHELEVIKN